MPPYASSGGLRARTRNVVNRIFPGAFTGPQEPPALSRGLPLVGHGVEFVRGTIELLTRAQREHGEVASIHVGPKKMVALFGPAAHEAVFRAPDRQLDVREAYKIMTPVFGEDMVYDAEPSRMNEQLKMLLPALKDRRMRTYAETVVAEVEQSIAAWGDEGEVDLVDYCRVLTNFTSSHCLLGREFRDGMTEKFARVYHDLERGVTPLAYINPYLPIPSFWKRDKARARLVEMIGDIVAQRRRTARRGEDFLQTLMDACYKSGAELTDHEITGMLLAAMFAGHHTSSVTTAWTLIELLQRPDYLAETVAELDRVHGAEPISFTSLRSVPLTDWAVKEALRLHPPLFMLVRTVKETFSFGRYEFAPDTWLLISPTVSHRMADVFIDPHRFDPHRFGPGREEDKRDFAYIPFGGGRHKCMGNAFALLQVKAILAVLLERFEFELVDREVGSDFHGLVVGPTEPCRVRYRRRRRRRAVGSSVVSSTRDEAGPARYRVVADLDLCQGHGVCVGESDRVFSVEEDRVEVVTSIFDRDATAPEEHQAIARAVAYCPTGALRIVAEGD